MRSAGKTVTPTLNELVTKLLLRVHRQNSLLYAGDNQSLPRQGYATRQANGTQKLKDAGRRRLLERLTEDATVRIMERPGISRLTS